LNSKPDPVVSVIVPTYNSAEWLELCLKSVEMQTYPHVEIIVVDKGSDDGTQEIARRHCSVITSGKERSEQRNYGAKLSHGEYLVFLDSDIELTPKVVEESLDKMKEGYDAVIFPEVVAGEGYWGNCRALEAMCYLGDDLIEAPRFIRVSVFKEAGGFDETLTGWEDWDLSQKIRRRKRRIGRTKALTIHHEGHVHPLKILKKKYYYGRTVFSYMRLNPTISARQIPMFRSGYAKNWRLLLRDPLHAFGLLILKSLELVATGLGMVSSALSRRRSTSI